MKCPKCGSDELNVIDSRAGVDSIRRRRTCLKCDARFTTYERIEETFPLIVKKDGRRESFDRAKILSGLRKACQKRPISVETIEDVVQKVELKLSRMDEKEIPARSVGELVMNELREVDQIAYVRFASVYREFSDVSQFMETLEGLVKKPSSSRKRNGSSRRT